MKFDPSLEPHCAQIAAEFANGRRRVAILAARRAVENGREPIEAADRAQRLFDELGHVSRIAQVVDEVAGPLNRSAFAVWLRNREAARRARVALFLQPAGMAMP